MTDAVTGVLAVAVRGQIHAGYVRVPEGVKVAIRRLPEKDIPECAGGSFAFQARQPAQSALCNGWWNTEGGRTEPQAGIFFDRNRLRKAPQPLSWVIALLGLVAFSVVAAPPEREREPRIGLVLGGGGARGAAHIGVLEVLERLRIPVACVAGTSMGALVAGAYAAGLTPAEMQEKLAPVDWRDMFSDDPESAERGYRYRKQGQRFYPMLELGVKEGGLEPVLGVVAGQKIKLFFNSLIDDGQGQRRIEDLRLPLSIMATDIGTGERVVLRQGSLSQAMRASMSVPGILAPVKIGQRTLVDGGLVDNVPIGEARALCHPDKVIAVDVGTPLLKPEEVNSLLSVAAQMVNILTNQNVVASLSTLQPGDVFIQPDLGDITAADFPRFTEAVAKGRQAAEMAIDKLRPMSVSAGHYASWRRRFEAEPAPAAAIDEIQIAETKWVNPVAVEQHIKIKPNEPLDSKKLEENILRIYGEGDYQSVDYALLRSRDRDILRITPIEKSWGPDYLLFGFNLSSTASEDSNFNLRGAYRRTWLNPYGGEWLTGAQIGQKSMLFTQFYQPLEPKQRFFVEPSLSYSREQLGLFQENDRIAQYRINEGRFAFDLGTNLQTLGQARLGWLYRDIKGRLDTGASGLPEGDQALRGWTASLELEQFDRLFFPTRGWGVRADVFGEQHGDYTKGQLQLVGAQPLPGFVIQERVRAGGALNKALPFTDALFLGGPLNLSGFAPGQLIGGEAYFGSLRLERILGQMPLGMTGDLRLGLSAEVGKMNRRYTETDLGGWLPSFSLYFGSNLPLGPAYLGYGYAPQGSSTLYLFVGTP